MKKAPKRYNTGGGVYGDDKDKAKREAALREEARQLAIKNKTNIVNPVFPSAQKQQGFNESTATKNKFYTTTGGGTDKSSPLQNAGGYTAPAEPYQNELGTYVPSTGTQYDKAGNVIPKLAKGGEVGDKFEGSNKKAHLSLPADKTKFNPNDKELIKKTFGVDIDKKAKGGTVKMTKAPRRNKGGMC